MAETLLLDTALWDLTVDLFGNIAVAAEPYAIAQDVASALRLFQGELWYDTTQGLPYLQQILGKPLSPAFLKAQFNAVAKTVPGVVSAKSFITSFVNRQVVGQVQIKTTDGSVIIINSQEGLPWYVTGASPVDPFAPA